MKTLSKQLNLSKPYTNHCLRATTITLLDNEGFEARHIMSISGHTTEAGIRSYSRTDDTQKRKIAKTPSDRIIGHASASKVRCETGSSVENHMPAKINDTVFNQDNRRVGNASGHASTSKVMCDMESSVKHHMPVRTNTKFFDQENSSVGNTSEPVMKSSNDIDFKNVELLELTSSQEHLLYEAVCNVSSDAPNVQSTPAPSVINTCTTRYVERKTSTVYADKTN